MRKALPVLLALLLALPGGLLHAQPSKKFWSSGPLSWKDYRQNIHVVDDSDECANSFSWETKDTTQEFGNLLVHRITSNVYLNRKESWVDPVYASDWLLRANQLYFDLNELQCRKMLRDIYDPEVNFGAAFLQDYYIGLTAAKISEINITADHGRDTDAIAYYETVIQSQLMALPRSEYNPAALKKGKHGLGIRMGLTGEFFLGEPAEYLSPAISMDFGLKYYYRKAMFELQFLVGALSVKKDFSTSSYTFYEDSSMSDLQANFIAGYSIYDGRVVRIAPYAGIGYNSLSYAPDDEDASTRFGPGGLRYMAGVETDFKVLRDAYLYPDDRSITEHSVTLRLYGARTGFSAGLDGYSINVGLCYSFNGWMLKAW